MDRLRLRWLLAMVQITALALEEILVPSLTSTAWKANAAIELNALKQFRDGVANFLLNTSGAL